MKKNCREALEKLRAAFHQIVKDLGRSDYLTVCEEFAADLEGEIEAAKQEAEQEE